MTVETTASAPPPAAERLAAIVESTDDAILSTDLNSVVTTWNGGAERMMGFTAREMIGTSVARLAPPTHADEEASIIERIRRGESVRNLDTVRMHRDGHPVHLSVTACPIRDASGRVIGASKIARDVSALRAREREIARLSALYAGLSRINQAIVRCPSRELLFERICAVLVEQVGFRTAWIGWHDATTQRIATVAVAGDVDGYVAELAVYADERPEGQGPSGRAFRDGQPYVCNDMLKDPATERWRAAIVARGYRASAVFPIREHGVVRGTLAVYATEVDYFQDPEIALLDQAAEDASAALDNLERERERREAAATAARERQFSDTTIESMPGVLYLYDESGRFLRWNYNFERISGYSAREIGALRPLDLFPPEARAEVERRIAEVFAGGEAFVEAPLLAKDGTQTPYFFTGRRVVFAERTCLIGVGIDISERTKAETALRELNETLELRVADRTAALARALLRAEDADRLKSAFLATMSHELRTPLNAIIGFTGVVLKGMAGPLTVEQTKQLGMVRSSARHLHELINDVLDLSKIEADQLTLRAEPFDVRASIEKVVAGVRGLAEQKGLGLTAHLAPELDTMVSDRRRVEQILLNLLSNAIKFTERGSVTLRAALIPVPSPALQVVVTDTGMGIAAVDLDSLFKPFRQIDSGLARNHEGTGLGLAICRRLAVLLGGDIVASSTWAVGSSFTVTLPLRGAAP